MAPAALGAILLENGDIDESQLSQALLQQRKSRSRLGEIMVADGVLSFYVLYHALAKQQGLTFVDLLQNPPQTSLLRASDIDEYLRLQVIPWRRREDKVVEVALCQPSEEVFSFIYSRFGKNATLVITSPLDIRRSVETIFGDVLERRSRLSLWEKLPHASARVTLIPVQDMALKLLGLLTFIAAFTAPIGSLLAILAFCHVVYMVTMLFKCVVFSAGANAKEIGQDWAPRLALMDDADLPVYTVIVPMYREPESVAGMLTAMQAMEYPAEKLDIKLVLEADDSETLATAYALKPRYQFEIIRVPTGTPRTKPRACNYALQFARGEYVTIFDADDRPDPQQLKKAVYEFRTLSSSIVCLQARLNYYNAGDTLITRFFALEYQSLFHTMLHGLQRLSIPIPLGGTSNHIALARLRELGEWDPYNVTEDADLGVRLAAQGYHTAMLDSYTMEEAPGKLGPWLRQRSRWIKGYMQTWLVHMRSPVVLYKALGLRGFIGFQFFVGFSSFAFLTAPFLWIATAWWAGLGQGAPFPQWLLEFTLLNLAFNLLSHWLFAFHASGAYRGSMGMKLAAGLYPLYMLLHSLASYKALWQLVFRPHFWEKTTHGRARSFVTPQMP